MTSLREIRKKLQSVANTKKITQAMEMVAGSRLRKAQAKAERSRPYAHQLKSVLHQLIARVDGLNDPLVTPRPVKKVGLVVIAGDRGLCGAYNQNIFTAVEKFVSDVGRDKLELILVGHKAVLRFSPAVWSIRKAIPEWGGKISFEEVKQLSEELMREFRAGACDEVWLASTHYVSVMTRQVEVRKLLPIEPPEAKESSPCTQYILEPNAAGILAMLLPRYCITTMQAALDEAYASELAARIFSMRAATKNAEELIEKLTLTRNKVRQAGITREMIEIIPKQS